MYLGSSVTQTLSNFLQNRPCTLALLLDFFAHFNIPLTADELFVQSNGTNSTETYHCNEAVPMANLVVEILNTVMMICCVVLLYLYLKRRALWGEELRNFDVRIPALPLLTI